MFESVQARATVVTCDPVTLAEVVSVLDSCCKVPPSETAAGLEPIQRADGFRLPGKERYLRALALSSGGVRPYDDACCCAVALAETGGRPFSFDRGLSKVEGVSRSEEPS